MQGRPPADSAHHLHAAAFGQGTLDVDDLVALADGEVDGLAGEAVQLAHGAHGGITDVETGLDQVAQFEQPQAQLVAAGVDAVDETGGDQIVEDAVRGGGVQTGPAGEFLQADGIGLLGQDIEQRHHAFEHLDGGFGVPGRARGPRRAGGSGGCGIRESVVRHQDAERLGGTGPCHQDPVPQGRSRRKGGVNDTLHTRDCVILAHRSIMAVNGPRRRIDERGALVDQAAVELHEIGAGLDLGDGIGA